MALSGLLALALGIAAVAVEQPPAPTTQVAEAPIVAAARVFMDGYARVLLAGDRAGIAARYDRRGAYLQGFGGDQYRTHGEITAQYRERWAPPRAFAWQDLRFEPLGPDAVSVTGRFVWTPQQGDPVTASYTSVLVRQEGELRLRVEHESLVEKPVAQ